MTSSTLPVLGALFGVSLALSSCSLIGPATPADDSPAATTVATVATIATDTTDTTDTTVADLPADTTVATTSPATTTPAAAAPADVLQLALTIHVERHPTEVTDEAEFDAHIAILQRLADTAIAYDIVLNFELSTEFVEAVDRWGSTFIEDMVALGHGIAQHSGDQSTDGLTGAERVAELVRQREAIEAHGVTVNYVSGACSAEGDWVESAIAAGFAGTTGLTEYCLKSLDAASLPDGMEWIADCTNPAVCHDPLQAGVERVLHPWTTSSSTSWLTDDPSGELVVLSADDADAFVAMSQEGDADLANSLEQWTTMLDSYAAATVAGQVNVLNTVLSVGPEPDWAVVEALFAEVRSRQAAGTLTSADLGDVIVDAVAEAPTQAPDEAVVYTDITPDLGGGSLTPSGGGGAGDCVPPECRAPGGTLPSPSG